MRGLLKIARVAAWTIIFISCGDAQETKPMRRNPHSTPVKQGSGDQTTTTPDNTGGTTTTPGNDNSAPSPTPGQPDPATSITKASLKQQVEFFSSAEFKGRGSATAENNKVAQFIADWYKDNGIQPVSGSNYFQAFKVSAGNTNNIIGMIPGSDPTLAQETVIVGAHMDHLGTTNGKMYPGADDNASGTAVLLHLARSLAANKAALKRTIVFIAFSGEELGLLGSRHYVQNPLRPLNKTVFMINMDMVGYGKGKLQALSVSTSPSAMAFYQSAASKYPNLTVDTSQAAPDRSDHAPFQQNGIPIACLHTGLHDNYHQPTDTPDKVDFDTMEAIAKITYDMTVYMANESKVSLEAKKSFKMYASPFAVEEYFSNYFKEHGLGRQPEPGFLDNGLQPGQPL